MGSKNKKIYCVFCGEKNSSKEKKCTKCHKKLNPKEHLVFDYVKDHIKVKVKGSVQDNVISFLKEFIKNHLYGIMMSATLIFTTNSGVIVHNENTHIRKVHEKPLTLMVSQGICEFANSIKPIEVCQDGYTLEDDTCVKEEENNAHINLTCQSGYSLSGNNCISIDTFEKIEEQKCIAPTNPEADVIGTVIENGICFVQYCSGYTDGECSAGYSDPTDFTVISYCPDGTKEINKSCKKVTSPNINYYCDDAELKDNKCIKISREEKVYKCSDGYILNEECNLCVLEEN